MESLRRRSDGRHSAATTSALDGDEHARLAAELPAVQRLPIGERLLLARRRRVEQVTRYERWLSRHDAAVSRSAAAAAAGHRRRRRTLRFAGAVSLLEAVRRRDIGEGS